MAGCTVREIEEALQGHRPGDRPDDRPDPAIETRRVTLELVSRSGFSEYYEPTTGEPLGGAEVS